MAGPLSEKIIDTITSYPMEIHFFHEPCLKV